jgi:hypothetical protein
MHACLFAWIALDMIFTLPSMVTCQKRVAYYCLQLYVSPTVL